MEIEEKEGQWVIRNHFNDKKHPRWNTQGVLFTHICHGEVVGKWKTRQWGGMGVVEEKEWEDKERVDKEWEEDRKGDK